jgi:hypothetical protein
MSKSRKRYFKNHTTQLVPPLRRDYRDYGTWGSDVWESPAWSPPTKTFVKPVEKTTVLKPKKPMSILLDQKVFAQLEAARVAAREQEFSGFGFVNVIKSAEETVFQIYDVVILDVGSSGFTEIPSEKILALMDRPDASKMKLWLHRHPIHGYVSAPSCWSGTDNHTIEKEPLGGLPETVKWSISIVRTPQTWVGRFDKYVGDKVITFHIPVVYGVEQSFINNVLQLRKEYEEGLKKQREVAASMQSPLSVTPAPRKRGSRILRFLVRLNERFGKVVGRIGKKIG